MSTTTNSALALIAPDMQALDRVIHGQLHTGVPLVAQVSQYIISAGGKRLRPALLLMMANALQYQGTQHHTLAAVVEFIHTATLLHDDVVDESTLRRNRPTANATFGNPAAVLVGDFMYTRAFQMMVACQNMRILQILADTTNIIAEGEVWQLVNMHDASLSEEQYLHVIRSKTACLFEASTRIAAVLANCTPEQEEACATYGQALGTAFQIIDDVLDYEGNVEELGKNLGDDLREGKNTLPLIIAMQRGTEAQAAVVRHAIEQGDAESLPQIVEIVRSTGALDGARAAAEQEAHRAISALSTLPANAYTEALRTLAVSLQTRKT